MLENPFHGGAAPPPRAGRGVCVYCGSRDGNDPRYAQAARDLGAGLAARGLRLVYGAGDHGLMGETARACLAAGGAALGVTPRGLFDHQISWRAPMNVVVAESMHQRKALMLLNADAVAVLPGGVGTLDEVIEVITWRQLGVHEKLIVLIDIGGFWAPLLSLFGHMARHGFMHGAIEDCFVVAPSVEQALDALAADGPRGPAR